MPQVNDCKYSVLSTALAKTGQIKDLENEWLLGLTGETNGSTNDLWNLYMDQQAIPAGALNDRFSAWLISLSMNVISNQLSDMWHYFWCDNGGVIPP